MAIINGSLESGSCPIPEFHNLKGIPQEKSSLESLGGASVGLVCLCQSEKLYFQRQEKTKRNRQQQLAPAKQRRTMSATNESRDSKLRGHALCSCLDDRVIIVFTILAAVTVSAPAPLAVITGPSYAIIIARSACVITASTFSVTNAPGHVIVIVIVVAIAPTCVVVSIAAPMLVSTHLRVLSSPCPSCQASPCLPTHYMMGTSVPLMLYIQPYYGMLSQQMKC